MAADPILDTVNSAARLPAAPLDVSVRLAAADDVPAVLSIIAALTISREDSDRRVFLRQRHSPQEYERYAESGRLQLALLHGHPVGFLLSFPWNDPALELERKLVGAVAWDDPAHADPSHSIYRDSVYIGEIGVDPRVHRRGTGRRLYGDLIAANPQSNLIATTIELPLRNAASAAFHLSSGFERIGQYDAAEFFGLAPYRSAVYLRKARG